MADLRARFGGGSTSPVTPVSVRRTPVVGDRDYFWVSAQNSPGYTQVEARLVAVTDHAYFFVENGLSVPDAAVRTAAEAFEKKVYPPVTAAFGPPPTPGIDGDPRIYVLIAKLAGLSGYHSSADSYPASVHPYSNEREIMYVSTNSGPVGSPGFLALLAHELQHLLHWNQNPAADNWINEGSSELAVQLAGFRVQGSDAAFLSSPDTQLTAWAAEGANTGAHYGASYLFMSYFAERFGSKALLPLLHGQGRGPDLFDDYLLRTGKPVAFDDLVADWAVANLIDDKTAGEEFGYDNLDVGIRMVPMLGPVDNVNGKVSQYAARYFRLPHADVPLLVSFDGAETTRIVPPDAYSGSGFWWSNRGDVMDTSLTTEVDLGEVSSATLRFRTWFDIEEHYDYAYVAVSSDGGLTWQAQKGRHTTEYNPTGNGLGPGYTGKSGGGTEARWVEEEIDLTPFAGQTVLLRFEYVTDDGYNGRGFVVDDIEIPELGWRDNAEHPSDWEARGFVHTRNQVPQRFIVRLVSEGPDGPEVNDLELDSAQDASFIIMPDEDVRHTLVIVAMAPLTVEKATFSVGVEEAAELLPSEAEGVLVLP